MIDTDQYEEIIDKLDTTEQFHDYLKELTRFVLYDIAWGKDEAHNRFINNLKAQKEMAKYKPGYNNCIEAFQGEHKEENMGIVVTEIEKTTAAAEDVGYGDYKDTLKVITNSYYGNMIDNYVTEVFTEFMSQSNKQTANLDYYQGMKDFLKQIRKGMVIDK